MLRLAKEHSGLDQNDEPAVLRVINNRRMRKRDKGSYYTSTKQGLAELRNNTGDWAYQGFAVLTDEKGFDSQLYNDHYYVAMNTVEGHAPETKYAITMTTLITKLKQSNVFDALQRSHNFTITWQEHNY